MHFDDDRLGQEEEESFRPKVSLSWELIERSDSEKAGRQSEEKCDWKKEAKTCLQEAQKQEQEEGQEKFDMQTQRKSTFSCHIVIYEQTQKTTQTRRSKAVRLKLVDKKNCTSINNIRKMFGIRKKIISLLVV